jgi:hypothetical protein
VRDRDIGATWQTACIDSWKEHGFKVVSLNSKNEIDIFSRFTSSVEFFELPSNHSRPKIDDFSAAIKQSGCKAAGIINADCLIIPGTDIHTHLNDHLDGIVMAERLNISPLTMRPTGKHCWGFDAFFFSVEALHAINQDPFWGIGQNWWDYWLPLAFHFAGYTPRILPMPYLAHLDHEIAWKWEQWEINGHKFVEFLREKDSRLFIEFTAGGLQTPDLHRLGDEIFNWLRSQEPAWIPSVKLSKDLVFRFFDNLADKQP